MENNKPRWAELVTAICTALILVFCVIYGLTLVSQPAEPEPEPAQAFGWLDRTYAKWLTFQTAVITNGNGTAHNVAGYPAINVQVDGIVGATMNFETTTDDSTWDAVLAVNTEDGAVATTATGDGQFIVPLSASQFRVRVSGWTSGTITVMGIAETHTAAVNIAAVLLAANDGIDVGDVTLNNTEDITMTLDGEVLTADVTGQGDVPITLDSETLAVSSNVAPAGKAASTSYTHDPGNGNTAAQIELAAPGSGVSHVVGLLSWSYNSSPTAGGITLEDETGTVWQVDVTAAGPGFFLWDPPLLLAANDMVTATLVAAGSGVTGTINIHTWTE